MMSRENRTYELGTRSQEHQSGNQIGVYEDIRLGRVKKPMEEIQRLLQSQ